MAVKKIVYIISFTILGILLNFLVHALIEFPALKFLVPMISWETWRIIHAIGTILLLLSGIALGAQQGFFWWKYIYVDKKLSKLKFKNKPKVEEDPE